MSWRNQLLCLSFRNTLLSTSKRATFLILERDDTALRTLFFSSFLVVWYCSAPPQCSCWMYSLFLPSALERALKFFKGAVAVISHNGSFVKRVCKETWTVEGGKVVTGGKL